MGIAIVSGLIGIAGILIGLIWSSVQQRAAARAADRDRAVGLFTSAARGITLMEAELALFRHRRDGRRPNFIALGNVALQVLAARAAGNWASGAASGLSGMTAWDASEGSRFTDRYLAAKAEAMGALVQLSLMSDGLQRAAGEVSDAIDAIGSVRKARDREAAGKRLAEASAGLRAAVRDYCADRPRKRGKGRPPALPARQVDALRRP